MNNQNLWFSAFIVFLFDQLTKLWAVLRLPYGDSVISTSWFSFNLYYNEDTFLLNISANSYNISPVEFKLLYLITALIIGLGIVWVTNQPAMKEKSLEIDLSKAGLFIIMGSLFGNLADRVFRNKVVDFIKLDFLENSQPVINMADVMIYVGIFAIALAWIIIISKCVKNCFLRFRA